MTEILPFITLVIGYVLGAYPYRKLDKCIVAMTGAALDKLDKYQEQAINFAHSYSDLSTQLINQLRTDRPSGFIKPETLPTSLDPEEFIDSLSGGLP